MKRICYCPVHIHEDDLSSQFDYANEQQTGSLSNACARCKHAHIYIYGVCKAIVEYAE